MEAGSGPQGAETRKVHLTTLTFAHAEGLDIEQAIEQSREIIQCGDEREMTIMSGHTWRTRERESLEEFSYGSEQVFRNPRALAEARGEVAPLATVSTGGVPVS